MTKAGTHNLHRLSRQLRIKAKCLLYVRRTHMSMRSVCDNFRMSRLTEIFIARIQLGTS